MSNTTNNVYPFTDTARLPWIIHSGELRPGRNAIGGYPDPDFLWATACERGDATASMHRGDGYRDGRVRHVRFTLSEEHFFPWNEVPARYPAWTADQATRLQLSAIASRADPATWWCRAESLPLAQAIAIDWRSYQSNRWTPLPPINLLTGYFPVLVLRIGGRVFASRQHEGPNGSLGYALMKTDMNLFEDQ